MTEELVVEEGASKDLLDAVEAFKKEDANDNTEQESNQEQSVEQPEATPEQSAEATDEGAAKAPDVETESLVFKVKGHEKSFSKEQINNMLNREQTFQQKHESLRNSDEYKMGLLLSAAKGGDKGAQKELKNMLSGLADLDELDDVKDSYDVEENHKKLIDAEKQEEPFEDVKDEVDFQETLDRITQNLAPRMPKEIFDSYWEDPASKRALYDLERSGQADALFNAFDEEMAKMSTLDRAKVNSDPLLYGNLFAEVVKSQNAKQVAGTQKVDGNTDLDVVSTGQSSHSTPKPASEPDWENMSKEEFDKLSAKLLKKAPRDG